MADETSNTQPDSGGASDAPNTQKPPADMLSLRGPNHKATRFKPTLIRVLVLGGVVLLALAFLYALSNSPNYSGGDSGRSETVSDTRAVAAGLQALPGDYSQVKAPEAASTPPESTNQAAHVSEGDTDATNTGNVAAQPPQREAMTDRARRQQMQRITAARASGVFFPANTDKGAKKAQRANAGGGNDPYKSVRALRDRLFGRTGGAQPPSMLGGGGAGGPQSGKLAFANNAGNPNDSDYLKQPYRSPISPYELKAGTIIPAALETPVNSDLPGQVKARVTRDVYDTVTGDYLLIPQGAVLIGKYNSDVSFGQSRLQLVWQRLIMPNGDSINLAGMGATDAMGRAGVSDEVDYHVKRLGGAILLSTVIAAGANYARGNAQYGYGGQVPTRNVIGDTIAQQASQIGQKIVQKQLNVQPTIRIRAGHPVRVFVSRDIVLRPYD